MALIFRQICQLVEKNLLIAAVRRPISTTLRAVIFPLAIVLIVSFAQEFFNAPQHFGTGTPSPILSLKEALSRSSPARDTVAFVIPSDSHSEIRDVYKVLSDQINQVSGKKAVSLVDEDALQPTCKTSHNGASRCYGAVVFRTSPHYPQQGGDWNYTLRADRSLGNLFNVQNQKNDAQVYTLPLQQAVDQAIISSSPGSGRKDMPEIQQYPFTVETEEKRQKDTHQNYIESGISYFGVVFFLGMVGVAYQSTGSIAYERESGLSQLIEAMMPNTNRIVPAMIRLFSSHLAFSIIYFPSWLAIGLIIGKRILTHTPLGIIVLYHIMAGLALCSISLFGAACFKKAQLSGICIAVIAVILAVIPQVLSPRDQTSATVNALGLIFPSSNYVYFMRFVSYWEVRFERANFSKSAPKSPWKLEGSKLFWYLALQIVLYPIAALCIELILYGNGSKRRKLTKGGLSSATVQLKTFTKTYRPSIFAKMFTTTAKEVQAVKSLEFSARKGEISTLLGPNGSGKSTTLNVIAGLSKPTGGLVEVNGSGGLGITPQMNILWDDLTVEQHVRIFFNLKSTTSRATSSAIDYLLHACDIHLKAGAKAKTLSGGQKRKLQLAMMFAGGSAVCCVDEVSSGLDPLSRRKVWDILLAQRSSRTIIMTTHFLDEAEFLSDHIAVLSKGSLKAEGSAAELKNRFGNGYTIETSRALDNENQEYSGQLKGEGNSRILCATDAAHATRIMTALERDGVKDYRVSGPTLEDVFLRLAGTSLLHQTPVTRQEKGFHAEIRSTDADNDDSIAIYEPETINLQAGSHTPASKQTWILFLKRLQVFKYKWGPHLSAMIVALIGAGVSPLLMKWFSQTLCFVPGDDGGVSYNPLYRSSLANMYSYSDILGGPASSSYDKFTTKLTQLYPPTSRYYYSSTYKDQGLLQRGLQNVTTWDQFNNAVKTNLGPEYNGAFWLGDASSPPTVVWKAFQGSIHLPMVMLNILTNGISDTPIIASYNDFDIPREPYRFDFAALLFCAYFSLISCLWPALYALYPTIERLRQSRALQYSNGVRSVPIWLAYFMFDAIHVLIISAVSTGLLSIGTTLWYHLPYIFLILLLYGFASTLLGYIISMFARSQLAAWALCASGQAVMALGYLGAYIGVSASTGIADLNRTLLIVQNTMGIVSPVANLTRSLFVSLNQWLIVCNRGGSPGAWNLYGSPIFFLFLQCILFSAILLLWDSGLLSSLVSRSKMKLNHVEGINSVSQSQITELKHQHQLADAGLNVKHLSKSFGSNLAVDDLSFSISKSEIFALLGPNGAGKSTAISLIRGDIAPSSSLSSIHVSSLALSIHRAAARSKMGVCPQFSATDVLSVSEHLHFYARIRGVPSPAHNVDVLLRVFGLEPYRYVLASKLSGGTQRKLSLAIAMASNPEVLLLDEPSSGLDAASKRTMWKALRGVRAGRSVLLTTHSMEEADKLADRAGIMSGRLLVMDETRALRERWGDGWVVQVVLRSGPYTGPEDMERVRRWVMGHVEGAKVEERQEAGDREGGGRGQMKFTVPTTTRGGVNGLFQLMEGVKDELGVEYYAIGETTLDQVFVNVVRKHGGVEEGHAGGQRVTRGGRTSKGWRGLLPW